MTSTTRLRPLFTLRTDEIVGRSEEIAKLQRVLADLATTIDQTLFFYIAGDGGMGKTRFLEWILQEYSLPPKTLRTPILDFYNSILRTDVDLVEHIYDAIEPDLKQEGLTDYFAEYCTLRERFRRQEADAAGGQSGESVIAAFVKAWTPIADAGYRLIVLLDTAELLRFEDDPVREKFNAPQPVASTKRWLQEMVDDDNKLPGVLFVVAGRKREAQTLYTEFCERAKHGAQTPKQRVIDLEGFQLTGTNAYFMRLTKILQERGYTEEATLIAGIDAEQRAALHRLAQGSPIALAIALQLLIDGVGSEITDLINSQLSQPMEQSKNREEKFQAALIAELANYAAFGEVGIVMRYMTLARKGLTRLRLEKLFQKTGSNLPKVDLISLFSDLAQQIFVKVLPDGSIVLHDKVAEWVFGLFEKAEAIKVYHALTEIYEEEILEQAHEIDRLLPFADPFMEVEEIDERKGNITYSVLQDPDAYKYANELRQTRRKRRNLIIEQMTYALRSNPLKGYKIYYERAEEAFNVGRMDYEMQIRTEFLQWWMGEDSYTHRLQAAQASVTKETIEADFAVRSVQRTYSATLSPSQRSQATIALINQILNRVSDKSDEFIIPTLAQSWLNLYGAMAHGQLVEKDDDIESIRQSFRSQIAELNGLLPGQSKQDLEDLDTFLIISALAFAYYELGYFESNHGNHGDAIESFNRSLPLYRKLGFEINLARSLNDKAYSLAVVGDAQRAETSINEALKLRKQLGFSFPIGLSYNTLAIVHTLGERPASALQYAKYALAVFRSLSHEFGQMLAYRASSEALRREAERIGVANRKLQQNRLLEALAASEAATTRADHLLTDKDALLVDIYIEYGSVWRDLARFYWQNPDLYDVSSDNPAKKSYDWLQKGIVLARMIPGARSHLIDAIVNLAYLNYYEIANNASDKAHVLDTAEQVVAAAIREIPEVYSKPASKHEQSKKLSVYWSLLGKAHGLLVTISRQRLQLKGDVVCMEDAIVSEARKLLEEATLTLYFSSQLESNVRNVRRSNQIIYEAFQTFTDEALKCFSQHADSVSQSLQILARRQEDISIKRFLADNFGIDPIM